MLLPKASSHSISLQSSKVFVNLFIPNIASSSTNILPAPVRFAKTPMCCQSVLPPSRCHSHCPESESVHSLSKALAAPVDPDRGLSKMSCYANFQPHKRPFPSHKHILQQTVHLYPHNSWSVPKNDHYAGRGNSSSASRESRIQLSVLRRD